MVLIEPGAHVTVRAFELGLPAAHDVDATRTLSLLVPGDVVNAADVVVVAFCDWPVRTLVSNAVVLPARTEA